MASTLGWTIDDWRAAYRDGARPDDLIGDLLSSLHGSALFFGFEAEQRQVSKRRVEQLFADGELLLDKLVEVVLDGTRDGVVVDLKRLNENAAFFFCTTGASSNLGQKLKGSLAGAKIWKVEAGVAGYDPDEGDARKVVAFGYHLGPDEDAGFPASEGIEGLCEVGPFADGVTVEPNHGDVR